MRDKVTSKNLKILIVCPSQTFASVDQKAITDALYLRDIGGNPTLYCLKDSFIEREAENLSLTRILFRGVKSKRLLNISYFLDIRKVLKEDKWDVVHCYHRSSLWALCIWLFYKSETALFFSFNEFFKRNIPLFWAPFLLRRVDAVFTFGETVSKKFHQHFQYPIRKIINSGSGIEFGIPSNVKLDNLCIGAFLNDESEMDNFRTLLFSLSGIKESLDETEIKVIINTFKPIKDFYLYSEIKKYSDSLGLTDSIEYIEGSSDRFYKSINLFVSFSFHEPVNCQEIKALAIGLNVVAPRTAFRAEMTDRLNIKSLKTYYFQDARAFKEAVLTLLGNNLGEPVVFEQNQELETYVDIIHSQYEIAFEARGRLGALKT
jgi:hypothetical protein